MEILLAEDEGWDFVTSRELAMRTKILAGDQVYEMSFISLHRLTQEIQGDFERGPSSTFRGYDKFLVLPNVTLEHVSAAVERCFEEGSIEYYLCARE